MGTRVYVRDSVKGGKCGLIRFEDWTHTQDTNRRQTKPRVLRQRQALAITEKREAS